MARVEEVSTAFRLDFDDAYQYTAAQKYNLTLLSFDTDFDHPMESVLHGHPERDMPFCVRHYRLLDGQGRVLHEVPDNHSSRNVVRFERPVTTDTLQVEVVSTHGAPAAIFEVRCYPAV